MLPQISNIYISALQFGGIPLQFVNAARSNAFRLAISEAILAETRGVLQDKFHWPQDMLDEAFSGLRDFTFLVTPTETLRVIMDILLMIGSLSVP